MKVHISIRISLTVAYWNTFSLIIRIKIAVSTNKVVKAIVLPKNDFFNDLTTNQSSKFSHINKTSGRIHITQNIIQEGIRSIRVKRRWRNPKRRETSPWWIGKQIWDLKQISTGPSTSLEIILLHAVRSTPLPPPYARLGRKGRIGILSNGKAVFTHNLIIAVIVF